jgi:hypothetical protein
MRLLQVLMRCSIFDAILCQQNLSCISYVVLFLPGWPISSWSKCKFVFLHEDSSTTWCFFLSWICISLYTILFINFNCRSFWIGYIFLIIRLWVVNDFVLLLMFEIQNSITGFLNCSNIMVKSLLKLELFANPCPYLCHLTWQSILHMEQMNGISNWLNTVSGNSVRILCCNKDILV